MNKYMVFDIGGTYLKYAVMDEKANMLECGRIPTPVEGIEELLQKIDAIVKGYKDMYTFSGIAVSSPGAVNSKTGFIGGASAISYIHNMNMIELLEKRTGLKTSIENDANCAALAEGWLGAAKNTDYYICVVIGTGIGGSIVLNRSILKGASLHGGEFGYMIFGSPLENPLQKTWSLTSSTHALVREAEKKKGLLAGTLNGEEVFQLAEDGDVTIQQCLTAHYKKLAAGIFNLKYSLDPSKILIGGGISKRKEVIDGINKELKQLKNETATLDIEVEACEFDNDANLIGALFHFLKEEKCNR
ncbi:ROK family protein [Metabacillus idriensis]|uniref:ROK family protein n=1 Tax=Metabacillus idriensis TaxID=324768 RepID=UPI003D2A16BF